MRPSSAGQFCFDNTVLGTHSFNDLTAANVNADVPVMPNGKTGNVRHGVDGAGLCGTVVHLISPDVKTTSSEPKAMAAVVKEGN